MLRNRLYRGEIVHKNPALSPPAHSDHRCGAFGLTVNRGEHRSGSRARHPSLLAGLIFDAAGQGTPRHVVKQGQRYRYYASRSLVTGERRKGHDVFRLPASELERGGEQVLTFLRHPDADCEGVAGALPSLADQQRLIGEAAALVVAWPTMPPAQQRETLRSLVSRVVVTNSDLRIALSPAGLASLSATCPLERPFAAKAE